MDIFVCGTDTACGKTVASAVLARHLGSGTAVIKPVQTGCPPDDDAAWIGKVTEARTYVWERFSEPLSPAVCARREGRNLDLDDLARRTLDVQAQHRICEPAGGLLAPLTRSATMADLAAALAWPLIVAARPGLGTLNHTALTVDHARALGLDVVGVVVSGFRGGVVEETNLDCLAEIAPVLGVVPWHDDIKTSLPQARIDLRHPHQPRHV